ncbi:MAG: hypothetical protein K6G55_04535 [Selenomonadaceae bacterium]|nr:hypothetical protein [Selenomonadaceae bacterium]
MNAFHTLRVRGKNEDFTLPDFELFTLVLSALEWRKHNGFIKLVTDSIGEKYLYKCGLSEVWDKTEVILDEIDTLGINEDMFWAGAKIYALSRQDAPSVMIDLDFILWKAMEFDDYGRDIAVIHREDIYEPVYPPKNFFLFRDDWHLPNWLDWSVRPCNGALVYFGSPRFMREYTHFALEFMQKAKDTGDRLSYMVFIEQRWMAMCAEHLGLTIHEFSTLEGLFDGKQKYFTHVWGYKQRLRDNPKEAADYCRKCVGRLRHDFPGFAEKLKSYVWAGKYMAE